MFVKHLSLSKGCQRWSKTANTPVRCSNTRVYPSGVTDRWDSSYCACARAAQISLLPCTSVLIPVVCKHKDSVLMGSQVPRQSLACHKAQGGGGGRVGPVGYRYGSCGQPAPLCCSCAVGKHGTREATPACGVGASRISSKGPKLTSYFC